MSVDDISTISIVLDAQDATSVLISQASGVDVDFQGISSSDATSSDLSVSVEDDDGNVSLNGVSGPYTLTISLPDVEQTSEVQLNLVASNGNGNTTITETITLSILDVNEPGLPTSAFFRTISDTIITDPVLGFTSSLTDPSVLIGVTKNAATNSVSTFIVPEAGIGVFDDAIIAPQPTLGTVGTAPLEIFFSDIDGVVDGTLDPVFFDDINDELVGLPFNAADNTFAAPVTQLVSNGCAAGVGSGTQFVGGDGSTRDDILVGTSTGLFYVASGDANGNGGSGFSAPTSLVPSGDFCNLNIASAGFGRTIYSVYNPTTRVITGFQGNGSDPDSYVEEFTADLSTLIGPNLTPLLLEGSVGGFGDDSLVSVFADAQEGGSVVVISDVGVIPENIVINLDMESPTDLVLLSRGLSQDIVIVSPTSTTAVYIRDANRISRTVEVIEIGTGFDQVGFAAGAVAFASSTQGNIVVRPLQ